MDIIVNHIKEHTSTSPSVGIILGSGLEQLSNKVDNKQTIKYSEIPSFIQTTIEGHAGEFITGKVKNTNLDVVFANGRFHYYEGLPYSKVNMIIDIFKKLGCKYIITTNSSGCLDPLWSPGDLMIIDSHIDMTYRNKINNNLKKYGDKFYSDHLKSIALDCLNDMNLPIRMGTYGWTLGPTYETMSEIQLMQKLNIKAVGMSTVPEIERSSDLNLELLGISCLTNYAVGITREPLTHNEVVTQAKKSGKLFSELIINILKKINII